VRKLDAGLSLLLVISVFAQEHTIRTNVPLVVIPVSVTDQRGHFVYDLTPADFTVLDNGVPRPVRVEAPDSITAPLALVVLVQTSDISDSALRKVEKVGTMIQDAVAGANGSTAVITFADRVKVAQDFTSDDAAIAAVFRSLQSVATRKGRLLDAVSKGLELLAQRPRNTRSMILIIGESKDRGSETKLQDLLLEIQRSRVTIYSLAYSAYLTAFTTRGAEYSPPEGGRGWILDSITEIVHATKQDTCKLLTGATGGRQLKFETKPKLENDLIRLGSDIHSRYMLTFSPPPDPSPGFHKITVEIRGRPQLQTEARPGYWVSAEGR
jgi:VWFA-related protein